VAERENFCCRASVKGVSTACFDGLVTEQRFLATTLPASVSTALDAASTASRPSAYLRSRQVGRAWQDLQAISGLQRKFAYFRARALPSTSFIRDKYPRQAGLPLPLLYARRLFDLLRARPKRSPER